MRENPSPTPAGRSSFICVFPRAPLETGLCGWAPLLSRTHVPGSQGTIGRLWPWGPHPLGSPSGPERLGMHRWHLRVEIDSRPPRGLASTAQMVATLAFSREGEQLHHTDLALFPRAGPRVAAPLFFFFFLNLGLIGDGCIFNRGLLRQSCVVSPAFNSPLGRDFRVERVIRISGERTH